MSCNGCRVLRKGCSDTCLLRPCLQWIDSAEAQGHATVFVAKFFGRAGLMSFISNVPEPQRPALFQSLLYEACGRTINPVNGAAGLMSTGNWYRCQAAVETVLRGGTPRPLPELVGGASEKATMYERQQPEMSGLSNFSLPKRRKCSDSDPPCDLDLVLSPRSVVGAKDNERRQHRRSATPSRNSEESATTNAESGQKEQPRLLDLFV